MLLRVPKHLRQLYNFRQLYIRVALVLASLILIIAQRSMLAALFVLMTALLSFFETFQLSRHPSTPRTILDILADKVLVSCAFVFFSIVAGIVLGAIGYVIAAAVLGEDSGQIGAVIGAILGLVMAVVGVSNISRYRE